jgi:hypothetical protein
VFLIGKMAFYYQKTLLYVKTPILYVKTPILYVKSCKNTYFICKNTQKQPFSIQKHRFSYQKHHISHQKPPTNPPFSHSSPSLRASQTHRLIPAETEISTFFIVKNEVFYRKNSDFGKFHMGIFDF